MSVSLARFLRLEFNGNNITNTYECACKYYDRLIDKALYLYNLSFDTIEDSDYRDLIVALYLYVPLIESTRLPVFLTMPEENTDKVKNIETQEFVYHEVDKDNRAGVIDTDSEERVGFIPYNVSVFDNEGNIDIDKVVFGDTPPDVPYSPYYYNHENYLYLGSIIYRSLIYDKNKGAKFISLVNGIRRYGNTWKALKEAIELSEIQNHSTLSVNLLSLGRYEIEITLDDNTEETLSSLAFFEMLIKTFFLKFEIKYII